MQAFVTCPYGSPALGQLREIDRPAPAADEVLVRVRATSINPYDWHHLRGEPRIARLMPSGLGLRRPRYSVLGCDMAGTVEAVGADVSRFRPGDDVFALLSHGGFAEYVTVREDMLAAKPNSLSYEQAAAVPMAAITALLALRDKVEPGQRVLVNGASGGVGTFAVQIARAFGADVVGVCGKHNIDLVRSIGAGDVIDYRSEDFTRQQRQYDLVLDISGGRSLAACRKALAPRGIFVVVGGPAGRWLQPAGHAFGVLLTAPLLSRRAVLADTVAHPGKQQDLVTLTELIEAGNVSPVIDRCYSFDEIPAAIEYQEAGHASGKVVVTV
ncbi:NAD(P)-dependent alcohol dehydrogenase [Nocardia sp. Marseille-Q1738]